MWNFVRRSMASLSIQAKLLVFVVPVSLMIIGIAALNLVTGSMVRVQVDGAGRSIGELSGFKTAYSDMSEFLHNTTVEKRDLLLRRLKERSGELALSAEASAGTDMGLVLNDTRGVIDGLLPRVDELWSLHERTVDDNAGIRKEIGHLNAAAEGVRHHAETQRGALAALNEEAKGLIATADQLSGSAKDLTEILTQIDAAATAEAAQGVVNARARRLERIAGRITDSLPAQEKALGARLGDQLKAIAALASEKDVMSAAEHDAVKASIPGVRDDTARVEAIGAQLSKASVKKFADLSASMKDLTLVAAYEAVVRDAMNATVIELMTMMGEPTQAQADVVLAQLKDMQTALSGVPSVGTAGELRRLSQAAVEPGVAVSALVLDLVTIEAKRKESFVATAQTIDQAWMRIVACRLPARNGHRHDAERHDAVDRGSGRGNGLLDPGHHRAGQGHQEAARDADADHAPGRLRQARHRDRRFRTR